MLLTPREQLPSGDDWIYEVKYDGYRAMLHWDEEPKITSRNMKDLSSLFPEIIQFCHHHFFHLKPYLPLTFDGEIVFLENNFKSNFSIVQSRGKMRTKEAIKKGSIHFPCQFIVFDIVQLQGNNIASLPLSERKEQLHNLFKKTKLPSKVNYMKRGQIQLIEVFHKKNELWNKILFYNGEGIVGKHKGSFWESGKRSNHWIKVKNWRIVSVILTTFEQTNGYFSGAVYHHDELVEVTTFKHGLSDEEFKTLSKFFQTNGQKQSPSVWTLSPSICVDIACIGFDGKKLREPRFQAFRFDLSPEVIHWKTFQRQLHPFPTNVEITHPDKPIWPQLQLTKEDYLLYLENCAHYLLPFLQNRLLTAIRFPHGANGESFYQKNAPTYAPSFVKTKEEDSIQYILCNDIDTLLWLGNQLVLEFHIPFQTIDTSHPTEIVFDLDPPSVDEFPLAIEAALRMKAIFDEFHLHSFIKTSGGKGLQIYIPLPKNTFTYDDTRIFTEFICKFLVEQEPKWFTLERLKKNRGNKLYLDYVQHAEGKTIVAPYSPRGNDLGCIATPLQWNEVKTGLHPKNFTIPNVLERLSTVGNPFIHFFDVAEKQNFAEVLSALKNALK